MKTHKSTVKYTVSQADRTPILRQHEEEKRKHPTGWLSFDLPLDLQETVLFVAAERGYTIKETICFLLRTGLPVFMAEWEAGKKRTEWLAKAPAMD